MTVLSVAAVNGRAESVRLLLLRVGDRLHSPQAARKQPAECVASYDKLCMHAQGANPWNSDTDGRNALHHASLNSHALVRPVILACLAPIHTGASSVLPQHLRLPRSH